MSKTKSAGGASSRTAKSRPAAAKKPAAKKAAAKKPARAKKDTIAEAPPIEAEIVTETMRFAPVDEAEDAIIIAETIEAESADAAEAETGPDLAPELTDEERELSAIYGDDAAGTPAVAHTEYTDRQTRDEDRPMMPEINARAERKQQWQDRRDRRKQRRDERQAQRQPHPGQGSGPGPQPQHAQPPRHEPPRHEPPRHEPQRAEQRPQPTNGARGSTPHIDVQVDGHERDALSRVGTPLGDAAAAVFAQLRNGQPLPVRQLAAMMRKRSLVTQDPEQLWPQLKAELLGDERSYRTLGLRPRIVYRGRDLFAPGPVAMSATAEAEAQVAGALSRLASATHRALAQRVTKAGPQGFERLVHAYLVAAGYRDIEWIKRVAGIAYATTTAPGLGRMVLVSAHSGDQPIDRRGIGELRVGVEAKDLVAGILFAPRELSEGAEGELERAGRSISVVCGDQLVAAFIAAGVGVVSAAAPVHYLDDQLLDELLAGLIERERDLVMFLGRVPYEQALAEQLAARDRVWAGAPGTILLCEHPPVITLGRSANRANVLAAGDVPVVPIERGGDVTYHGPGQLMVYPIVRIRSVVAFLETVAGALAETCADFGVPGAAWRREPAGLWLGDAKLAACGIHVARGVSMHGWALNVATPPEAWQRIVPCGLGTVRQVALADAAGRAVAVADVAAALAPRLVSRLL